MKKLTLLLVIYSFIACNNVNNSIEPKRTVITGQIRNLDTTDNRTITVNYTDPINSARVARTLGEDGSFHTDAPMFFPQNITINLNGKFINLFVTPSDSLFVDVDMNLYRDGKFEGINISGESSHLEFNKQFPAFYDYAVNTFYTEFNYALPTDEFLAAFKHKLDESYVEIDSYASSHNILPELVAWIKTDLIYTYANYISDYGGDNAKARLELFTDPLFDIDNADNFSSMMFSYHLANAASSILGADSSLGVYKRAELLRRGSELLMKRPATLCRDYMIYQFIKRLAKDDAELLNSVQPSWFTNEYFATTLHEVQTKEYATLSTDGILYLEKNRQAATISDGDFFKYVTQRYHGKVLYIDIYATWCGPCIAEMEPSKQLRRLFADKDVVFIYLCLGSDRQRWIPTIDKYEIDGEHYFFDESATQLLLSAYNLAGYPSYMLVSTSGKLITTDAPRPSEQGKITETIDELLGR